MISARKVFPAICVFVISMLLSASLLSAPASEFTGSYSLGSVTAAGHDVQIMISLEVVNNTSANVSNATLSLHDPRAGRVTYGDITGVSIVAGGSSQASGSFTVPRALYDSWRKGSSPAMSLNYNDADGNAVRAFIQF